MRRALSWVCVLTMQSDSPLASIKQVLTSLGFGFIEVGTVTPNAQPGHPRPRLFRLPAARALINRMGFNNNGVDQFIRHVQAVRFKGVLGLNLGKNANTPIERAVDDYL